MNAIAMGSVEEVDARALNIASVVIPTCERPTLLLRAFAAAASGTPLMSRVHAPDPVGQDEAELLLDPTSVAVSDELGRIGIIARLRRRLGNEPRGLLGQDKWERLAGSVVALYRSLPFGKSLLSVGGGA